MIDGWVLNVGGAGRRCLDELGLALLAGVPY